MLKAYLAGPDVFLPQAPAFGAKKREVCARYGLLGLFPLDEAAPLAAGPPAAVAHTIYEANRQLLLAADLVIANLTPFRGPSMDVGTAFEVGFACARGIPVFGYSNVAADLAERTRAGLIPSGGSDRPLVDENGLEIEDFGLLENLMIAVPLEQSGAPIATGAASADRLYTDLTAFERCVARAAEVLGVAPEPLPPTP